MDLEEPPRRRSVIAFEPADIPAVETELFLREVLPPAPARVLEAGAGDGRLAARLTLAGWRVTAVDRSEEAVTAARARGVDAVCADFLDYRGGPFDVVAFTRSLHHMPLEPALEHAESLLQPGGVLIMEEFAYERADAATTRYLESELEKFRTLGYLASDDRVASSVPPAAGGRTSPTGPVPIAGSRAAPGSVSPAAPAAARTRDGASLERWLTYFRDDKHVHEGAALARAVAWRFDLVRAERAPYLYRLVAAELAGNPKAVQALIGLIDLEEQLISRGMIQAIGFRLVARPRRAEARG